LTIAHKLAFDNQSSEVVSDLKKEWLKGICRYFISCCKEIKYDIYAELKVNESQLVVFPAFGENDDISVSKLPNKYEHGQLLCYGKCVIAPFSYGDLLNYIRNMDKREELKEKLRLSIKNAASPNSKPNSKRTPQGQLIQYILTNNLASNSKLTDKTIGDSLLAYIEEFFALCDKVECELTP